MNDKEECVHIIDDDAAVRKGLARLLCSAGLAVETFASADEFLARGHHPGVGCIVLDVRMPGTDGIELQASLAAQGVDLPIVFLTGHGDIPMSVWAVKRGAVDFLTKPVDEEDLLRAVREGLDRHRAGRDARRLLQLEQERLQTLTPREMDVLRCVITGARNKQIAAYLGIAEKTVKIHRGRVMKKLGLNTVTALVQVCQRAKIEPGSSQRLGSAEPEPGNS